MANFSVITGTMGAGKTAKLISDTVWMADGHTFAAYTTESSGFIDSRNGKVIPAQHITELLKNPPDVGMIFIDEAQWLLEAEVKALHKLSIKIPIRIYGLKVDANGDMFHPMGLALALADYTYTIEHKCSCGKPAVMHKRVADNGNKLDFISICKECFYA